MTWGSYSTQTHPYETYPRESYHLRYTDGTWPVEGHIRPPHNLFAKNKGDVDNTIEYLILPLRQEVLAHSWYEVCTVTYHK